NSAIDINGKTVKVDGDYVQTSGEVILNGGSLEVAGDMRVSGNYFTMTDPDDYLLVNGDFLINTYYSHVDRLTDGVMEFKGNFTQRRVTHGNHTNFHATGNHLVVFSGDGDQVVDMASSLVTQSRFKNIMINTGGAVDFGTRAQFTGEIEFKTVNYLGDISPAEEARVKGNIWPGKLSVHQDWLVTQDIITDSFELKGGETDINALKLRVLEDGRISNGTLNANQGELIVDGEMDQTQGELRVGKGSVNIFGNYSIFDGYLTMTDPEGYLLVRGDFTMRSYYNHSTRIVDGVMEIKGDFAQHRNSSWGASNSNFKATDNHKIIFSGESAQNVSFSHPNSTSQSSFANLEIKNSEGVDFVTRSPFTGNLDHMDGTFSGNITPAQQATVQEGVWPGNLIVYEQWEMQDDLSVKGHLNATSGTIEVNGRELTVENNTLISGGRIDVNGGSLVTINDLNMTSGYLTINTGDALIGGDLTQSSNNISYIDVSGGRLEIKGDYNNLQDGFLYMKDPNDYVKIHGDFNMNSRRSHSGHLTDGVLEVKGDFAQRRYGGYGPVSDNFKATENHKVLLSGEGIQQVSFTNSSGAVSSFANLEIDNGEKVVFTTGAVATKQIDFISDDIEGALSPSGMAVVTGGLWPRDLILSDSWRMPHDLHINGDLKLANGTLYVNGKDISFAIEKGNMSVEGGNLDLQDSNLEVPLDIAITRGTLGLNGGKLSVNGDLSHGGGAYWSYVELDGGQLEVAGSYSMQSESLLRMDDPEDHIIIHGDFMTDSRGNHTGRLTDGVIELKGSFTQRRHGGYAPTSNNFRSTDSHKVIFSGNSVQEIYFGNPGTNLSHFADVEFNNPLGVELKSRVCVTEEITLNKTEVINPSNLYLALNGRISGNEWPFDFYVYENLKLQDNMVVYGKVHKISGEIDYDGYKILSVEEVDASSVNIGETLEKSRLTGIFKDPETDEAVEGELSWVEPETMVDSIYQSHSWIFRPSSDDYMEASGNVGIQGHPVMTGIKITSEPDKRVYDATEDFDITGLKVYSVWNYGDDQQLDLSDLTITGFDSSLPTEKQRVLVSYMGYSESFDVEIRAIEVEAVDVEAESANIGTTLESAVLSGEFLDSKTKEPIEGILEWVDESLQVTKLSEEFEWRFIPEEPKYTLVTGYMQVIGNPVLTGIEIARLPDKLEYEIGEEIDLDGLLVQSRWNYGSSRNISNSLLSVSGFDSTEATERQSITLGYDGFEASFGIKVNPPVEVIAVSIEDGESQELITQVIIDRQETLNGELQDKIIIGEEAAKEIIEHLKASSGDTARVRFPVGDEKVTMQTIEIPSETLAELKGKGINLEIDSDWGNIIIPKESLDEVDGSEVLYFRLVPIKSVDELKEIDETTQNQDIIKEVAGDGKIQRFALSMRIESNMAGHKVKITLPLDLRLLPNDNEQRANLLDDLWVYVEHSDGDRELIKPSVNTGFREGFVGMTFEVEKFSRFTLLRINQVDIAKPIEPVEDEQDFEQEPEEQREEVRKANNEEADNQQSMGEGTNTEEAIFVEREEDISKETEDETLEETIEADGTISEDIEEAKERKEERGIWKYAIIALALAVIAGMAVKKKK
ncbi:bacterial Ig-like domain-containing protein, partial [Alkalibacter saccharofermentans]